NHAIAHAALSAFGPRTHDCLFGASLDILIRPPSNSVVADFALGNEKPNLCSSSEFAICHSRCVFLSHRQPSCARCRIASAHACAFRARPRRRTELTEHLSVFHPPRFANQHGIRTLSVIGARPCLEDGRHQASRRPLGCLSRRNVGRRTYAAVAMDDEAACERKSGSKTRL